VTITRVGTNSKYASGWAGIFGKGSTGKKESGGTKVAAKPAKKKAAPKKKLAKKAKK
jgi:hypothetical protein